MVQTSMEPVAAPRRRPGVFRRVIFPLIAVAIPAVALILPKVWVWADMDPRPLFDFMFYSQLAVLLGVVMLLVWLLFLSGFRWRTKFIVLAVVAVVVGGFVASVRSVDIKGDLGMVFVFKWESLPNDRLEEQRRDAAASGGKLAAIDLTIDPLRDFPRYRGPNADGVVRGVKLAPSWSSRPPRKLWQQPCGGGFAGFAVAGNVAITLETRKDEKTGQPNEAVVCYDRATGRERWVHAYDAHFPHATGSGPRSTPTIDHSDVFTVGATGWLLCLDSKTGKERWSVNILEDNGATNVTWAMAGSPLVIDSLVIVNPGINPANNVGKALAAYDRATGKRVWASGKHAAGYSSPQRVKLADREQVLLFDAGGLAGFDPKDGRELWRHEWPTFQDMNIIQPVVLGDDRVFVASETTRGCGVLRVRANSDGGFAVEPVWNNRSLCARYANPVLVGGNLYGLSLGYLVCVDAETGQRRWRGAGGFGNGQLLAVGDVLLVQGEFGELRMVAADAAKYHELGHITLFDAPKTWNTPALAGRQLFVRNHLEMACWELPEEQETAR
jgi:outer membrane protein assembly factor BamB